MSKPPLLTIAPFDNDLARDIWDQLATKASTVADFMAGHFEIQEWRDYSVFVSLIFSIAALEELTIVPELLIGWIRQFPDGPFFRLPDLEGWTKREWARCRALAVEAAAEQIQPTKLRQALSARTLLARTLPPQLRILGDVITANSRTFLVGPTGAGKTMLGFAMAIGAASGCGFLGWRSERAFRVLYIDGEMPLDLLQERLRDGLQRAGDDGEKAAANLFIYSMETAEEIAAIAPAIGLIEPLNNELGQNFIRQLCAVLEPDLIILDNVQSLIFGVQKEEETWVPVLALVQWLTSRRIGQLWIDHTARSTGMQYGTSTKSWRFDTVMAVQPVADDQREAGDALAFSLTFDKSRRAKPAHRSEFEPQVIRLTEQGWMTEKPLATAVRKKPLTDRLRQYHRSLLDAIVAQPMAPGETTREAWLAECIRTGLVDEEPPMEMESGTQRATREASFRKAIHELREHGIIGIDGKRVMDLSQRYR